MSEPNTDPAPTRPDMSKPMRVEAIDLARGIAILAMFVYHFCWNLAYFRYLGRHVVEDPLWRAFAISIAASFLFLVGVSLVLANQNGMRWRSFFRRLAFLVAAAALVTLATYWLFPTSFIFFGILHSIAVASLLGLAFLRIPLTAVALAAMAVFLAPHFFADPYFDAWYWRWLGLMTYFPQTNDYEPVLPWFAATLTGILVARVCLSTGVMQKVGPWRAQSSLLQVIAWGGRRSLLIYLIHQPILFGLVWVFALIAPAPSFGPLTAERYQGMCTANCIDGGQDGRAFCSAFCACMDETLTEDALMAPLIENRLSNDQQTKVGETAYMCQETLR